MILRHFASAGLLSTVGVVTGCSGIQSALDPAGAEADAIAKLFWVLVAVGTIIWLGVSGILLYGVRSGRRPITEAAASSLILWGGVFTAATLVVLLGFALWLMPSLRPFAGEAGTSLRIEITGRQYWWRVVYHVPGYPALISANEVRLPVGERVELTLHSDDVIHSFWIPALGGKMDMIPGRENRLSLLATKPGTFRGPCAEFCGTSHALMAFSAVAMESKDFHAWLASRVKPSPGATAGAAGLFLRHGCGSCHTVAGTEAAGTLGPDLSHLGSRLTLGAGILPNTAENIARFITEPDKIKPGVEMPAFGMLPPDDIRAIAAWLKGLE
ncbi:cytochrome c oxidase subunit II [Mesorhizobium sp. LHD-90]|uniref:cytochrome c oxidase subunit II n=1 Tax=Mesorhizobium sp. LHD-90 TaxID=3071414 RepID=UPI0027E05F9C|nr:cytochrome c oxidase subunit II [Mesorhizobium sp. LHD-90]MDQ6432731.1 cytochrome c oxidase subunit II [Mesorhizobium sp. LHD-90]